MNMQMLEYKMNHNLLNTHQIFEILESGGFTKKQSTAITKALETIDTQSLVTKPDLSMEMANLKADLYKFILLNNIGLVGLIVGLIKLL